MTFLHDSLPLPRHTASPTLTWPCRATYFVHSSWISEPPALRMLPARPPSSSKFALAAFTIASVSSLVNDPCTNWTVHGMLQPSGWILASHLSSFWMPVSFGIEMCTLWVFSNRHRTDRTSLEATANWSPFGTVTVWVLMLDSSCDSSIFSFSLAASTSAVLPERDTALEVNLKKTSLSFCKSLTCLFWINTESGGSRETSALLLTSFLMYCISLSSISPTPSGNLCG